MSWEQDELDFGETSGDLEREEELYLYNVGAKFLRSMLAACQPEDNLYKHTQTVLTQKFLRERLDIDYEPFTGKVKWEPTGLTNVHGGKVYGSLLEAVRRRRKPVPLPVDVNFYTFDMIRHAYDMGDLSGEEYLENVRRKVAFENESE